MRMRYSGIPFMALLALVALTSIAAAGTVAVSETPTPSIDPETFAVLDLNPLGGLSSVFDIPLTPGLAQQAEAFNFDDNPVVNNNFLFIPPDPYCAAGPEHVLNTGNVFVEWRLKNPLVVAPQVKDEPRDVVRRNAGHDPVRRPDQHVRPQVHLRPSVGALHRDRAATHDRHGDVTHSRRGVEDVGSERRLVA